VQSAANQPASAAVSTVGEEERKEKALFCLHRKARILVALSDFEAAKSEFLLTLKESDLIYSHKILEDGSINKTDRFSFSQLKNKVTVLCNLSECYKGLAQYTEAKESLVQAELLFEKYATYYKESNRNNNNNNNTKELSEFKQNKKATSKLRITVYECMIDIFVELYELESAVPYTEKAQAVCIDLYGANHHKTSLMSCKAGNLFKSLGR
jgi:tetratricopeptide (TPR) repeat protein